MGKTRSPWIDAGFTEYAKRLPKEYQLNLIEIPIVKRTKSMCSNQIITIETQKLLAAVPKNSLIIALDEQGQEWSTQKLAAKIAAWQSDQLNLSLLIGGPDGLAKAYLQKITLVWSLTLLTLPHQLVKIIVAEQLYRAWSIINNHPYHRS